MIALCRGLQQVGCSAAIGATAVGASMVIDPAIWQLSGFE